MSPPDALKITPPHAASDGLPATAEPPSPDTDVKRLSRERQTALFTDDGRLSVHPVQYPGVYEFRSLQEAAHWTAVGISFARDTNEWRDQLSECEREALGMVFGFFYAVEPVVGANVERFIEQIKMPEARAVYSSFANMERTHEDQYGRIIYAVESDQSAIQRICEMARDVPAVAAKLRFTRRWFDAERPFGERMLAFACVEGIFFSGAFAMIFWLKQLNVLKGVTTANEYIARDEGLHRDFAVYLYKNFLAPVAPVASERIREIVGEAVGIARSFVASAMRVPLRFNLNRDTLGQYIEFVADHLLESLGEAKMYRSSNPFPFMENISLQGRTNHHEKEVTEYRRDMKGADENDYGSADVDF